MRDEIAQGFRGPHGTPGSPAGARPSRAGACRRRRRRARGRRTRRAARSPPRNFAHDLPDLPATEARLLRNQDDIGDAIKPYYGRAAGNQLTALLKDHVGAVALLKAANSGDQAAIKQRTDEWYANGNEIADFLHRANARN